MPRTKKVTDDAVRKVALLLSQGKTQAQICEQIDMKQASVSRAKGQAIERGYLVQRLSCSFDQDEIEELEFQIHCPELLKRLQQLQPENVMHLRRLRILKSGHIKPSWDEQRIARYRDEFGERVAEHLLDNVFPNIASMGVTWGGTLLAAVRGIAKVIPTRVRRWSDIEFLPVCGAPPDAIEAALLSSTHLIASLDESINGTKRNPNNFNGVSAAISSNFTESERRALDKYFFSENKGYRRVFGGDGERGRIDSMAAVMTSVGSNKPSEDPWIQGAAEAAGVTPTQLSRCVIGNIGGWFLPRMDNDKKRMATVRRVNERWTGIKLEHYLDCSARARKSGHGGTILVSSGKKSEIVVECIRRGLVAELLIDAELAEGLGKAIGFRPGNAA